MPSMKLNSGSLDHLEAATSAPHTGPAEEWSTTLRYQSSRSEAVGKRRNTETYNPRQLELRRDLLQSYDLTCSGSATEMFGQMTPSSEEEEGMRLGNEIDTPEILPKESALRAPPADTNTPEESDVEDFEFSFEEFEKRYKPLSNLPTPPWSDSSPAESVFEESDGMLNPEFYGEFYRAHYG